MKPIYQMSLGISDEKRIGLKFSSEIEDDINQSPIFALPIPGSLDRHTNIEEYLSGENFYFPGIFNNQIITAESEPYNSSGVIYFTVPEQVVYIGFRLRLSRGSFTRLFRPKVNSMPVALPYVGRESLRSMAPSDLYIPLMPLDAVWLDVLYREKGFAFVGLTPNFGASRNDTTVYMARR